MTRRLETTAKRTLFRTGAAGRIPTGITRKKLRRPNTVAIIPVMPRSRSCRPICAGCLLPGILRQGGFCYLPGGSAGAEMRAKGTAKLRRALRPWYSNCLP
jgi:hypothetical protein